MPIPEELQQAIDGLRAQIEERGNRDAEASARLDTIEQAASEREANVVALRTELDALAETVEERANEIRDLQQQSRVAAQVVTAGQGRGEPAHLPIPVDQAEPDPALLQGNPIGPGYIILLKPIGYYRAGRLFGQFKSQRRIGGDHQPPLGRKQPD